MHMYSGDFVASCSMDHTAKLWDVQRAKCRGTLRGHVDSINAIIFQPFSNNICTCAGDKTVSRAAVYILYINIYVYMCMYVYMYVYVHVCMHMCVCTHVCTFVYAGLAVGRADGAVHPDVLRPPEFVQPRGL